MAYSYQENELHCDGVALADIAAKAGTPCYIYSAADIVERYCAYDQAFGDVPHQIIARLDRPAGGLRNGHSTPSRTGHCPLGAM